MQQRLYQNFVVIRELLEKMAEDEDIKADACLQAEGFFSSMSKLKTGIMVVLWNRILQRFQQFQSTSATLQAEDLRLNTALSVSVCLSVSHSLPDYQIKF